MYSKHHLKKFKHTAEKVDSRICTSKVEFLFYYFQLPTVSRREMKGHK